MKKKKKILFFNKLKKKIFLNKEKMDNQEKIEIPEEKEEKLLSPQQIIKMNDEQTEELIKRDDL
jgi:hypothetical protein